MSDELAELPTDLSEITLEGDGPFALPTCQSDPELRVTDTFATLVMHTILEGKEVHVQFSHEVLARLRDLAGEAIARIQQAGPRPVL